MLFDTSQRKSINSNNQFKYPLPIQEITMKFLEFHSEEGEIPTFFNISIKFTFKKSF